MAIIGDGMPQNEGTDKIALARQFNDAVDSLFLTNFMISQHFYSNLRSHEQLLMKVTDPATPSGQAAASRVVRAGVFAEVLSRTGFEAEARALVPAWAKTAEMRESLENGRPAAPALARLCR